MYNKKRRIFTKNVSLLMCLICMSLTLIKPMKISATQVDSVIPTGYTHTGTAYGTGGVSAWYDRQSIDQLIIDGQVGFCIEPWKVVTDLGNYTPNAYTNNLLAKIVYHGFWNTARNPYDYAVTQLTIWEQLGYTATSHTVPNYQARKKEIMNAVDNHDKKPSFSGITVTMNKDETITLSDSNKILNQMSLIKNETNTEVEIKQNTLTIKSTTNISSGDIKFRKIKESAVMGASIIFNHPNSQNIAVMKLSDPLESNINIRVSNGKVKFSKTGEVFTHTLTGATEAGFYEEPIWEKASLLGSELSIHAAEQINDHSGRKLFDQDQLVDTIESTYDEDYSNDLPQGKYYAFESKIPFGYLEDFQKTYFEVTADGGDNQLQVINLYNERPSLNLKFNKQLETHDVEAYENINAYSDVRYGIFAREDIYTYKGSVGIENGTMVKQFIIDENGNPQNGIIKEDDSNHDGIITDDEITYDPFTLDLPIGAYYLKELATNPAFDLDVNEYNFSVEYQGASMQNITLHINDNKFIINELKDFSIRVNKVDSYTNTAIKSKKFGFTMFTDSECKNAIQTVSANTGDGTATFEGIHFGEYWIKETKAPVGYILSDEVKHLVINEEGVFINGKMITEENGIYSFIYGNQIIPSMGDTTDVSGFSVLVLLAASVILICLIKKKKEV